MVSFSLYSEALEEAYVAAPIDNAVLATIELRHSSFKDDQGNLIAIRMVQDPGELIEMRDDGPDIHGHYMRLEDSAPMNAGQIVLFQSVMFSFSLPEQSESKVTGMKISFDNVTRIISKYLDAAVKERSPMALIYREYLENDLFTPEMVISNLSIKSITSTVFTVEADADFADFLNKKFPNKDYRPTEFPGLVNS